MNVISRFNTILPNITFKIETPAGVVLAQFDTGDIPVTTFPIWKQYGFFFTTPSGSPKIVLRMTNNAPGGIGNDIALDDITFRPCGAKVNASILGNTDTVNVCEGNTNVYNFDGVVSSAYQSPVYQWQVSTDKGITWKDIPGANSTSYTRLPTTAGNYWYRLTVVEASAATISSCRIASNMIVINIHPKPLIDAGPDRVVLTGNSTTLSGKAEGESVTYSWTPDNYINNISSLNPIVTPVANITYLLSGISAFGCSNKDSVLVKVVTGIYVPTAFTPNNDGKNDNWKIPFLDPAFGATVNVFNRYGQLVYHCADAIVSWNGKLNDLPQPTGVYVYSITFKGSDLKLKGTVTLIR
jgi:gliding motility-associated-like protein